MREPGASPGRSRRCEGMAPPPKCHWRSAREDPGAGKAVGEGAPSQKTCRLLHIPSPSRKDGFVLKRLAALVAVAGLVLVLAAGALAATVTVRVEGKTQTIFGSLPVTVDASNPLQALDIASTLGEFHYQITSLSFGDYVSQVGKYAGVGNTGWVFKVNGVSPPVAAGDVKLADGDSVLWYFALFGETGGPPTLELKAAGAGCYTVFSQDDAGKRTAAAGAVLHVDGRRVKAGSNGRGCVGKHRGTVRAYAVGAVRSNALR